MLSFHLDYNPKKNRNILDYLNNYFKIRCVYIWYSLLHLGLYQAYVLPYRPTPDTSYCEIPNGYRFLQVIRENCRKILRELIFLAPNVKLHYQ